MPVAVAGFLTIVSPLYSRAMDGSAENGLRIYAGMVLAGAFLFYVGSGMWFYGKEVREQLNGSRNALRHRATAYAWIKTNTDPNAIFLVYRDIPMHLHTERKAVRQILPIMPRHDPAEIIDAIKQTREVARRSRARYILTAFDDFTARELTDAERMLFRNTLAGDKGLRQVYNDGKTIIYEVL